jgi:hypothetical protein
MIAEIHVGIGLSPFSQSSTSPLATPVAAARSAADMAYFSISARRVAGEIELDSRGNAFPLWEHKAVMPASRASTISSVVNCSENATAHRYDGIA